MSLHENLSGVLYKLGDVPERGGLTKVRRDVDQASAVPDQQSTGETSINPDD
jgi:hypothetical protein